MADAIQALLDQMVPEFEDLQKKGIFTSAEVKAIIKKRTQHEYSLRRRKPDKVDFYRAIQYEMNLDALRKKRKKRLGTSELSKFSDFVSMLGIKSKNAPSDYSAKQRIHQLFDRLTGRFGHDEEVWIKYIEFCKNAKSTNALNKTFARAIQQHPLKPLFWRKAALHEYHANANINGARNLLQRGLRLNSKSKELWLSYFQLELAYLDKILKRMEVLGFEDAALQPDKENSVNVPVLDEEPDKRDSFVAQEEVIRVGDPSMKKDTVQRSSQEVVNPFLKGAVLQIIYKNAIQKIPEDREFRLSFLNEYSKYPHIDLKEGIDYVYKSIETDFASDAQCVSMFAQKAIESARDPVEGQNEAMRIFEEKLEGATGEVAKVLWTEYTDFMCKLIHGAKDKAKVEFLAGKLLDLLERALKKDCCSEDMFHRWITLLLELGKIDRAKKISSIATNTFKRSVPLWLLAINLLIKSKIADGTKMQKEVREKFMEAIKNFRDIGTIANVEEKQKQRRSLSTLYMKLLEFCTIHQTSFEDLNKYYQEAIGSEGNTSELREYFLEHILIAYGIEKARQVYQSSFLIPPASLSYFLKCIHMEKNNPKVEINVIRNLYERTLSSFPNAEDVWLDYIKFETEQKNFKKTSDLYWKAKKTLENPTEFVRKHASLFQQE